MNGNENIREIAFEEKLASFKKETKDFFASYQNKSGGEDCIEVCLIRSGYRTVLKAEEIINRLKVENEALKDINRKLDSLVLKIRAEAIKEFVERLECRIGKIYHSVSYMVDLSKVYTAISDNLKEMTGGGTDGR